MRNILLSLACLACSGYGRLEREGTSQTTSSEVVLNCQKMEQLRPKGQGAAADSLTLLTVTLLSLQRLAAGWQVTASGHRMSQTRGGSIFMIPEKVHLPYTKEDDSYLWEHKDDPPDEIAEALGRGVNSVIHRLGRLENPKTEGHIRLFGVWEPEDNTTLVKLPPLRTVGSCINRIIHDPSLQSTDFRVGYRDRFRKALKEIPFDMPNTNIKGPERMFVRALPEHRIEYLKYKKQVIWHKKLRRDDVFGSCGGLRIQKVIANYDAWVETRRSLLQRGNSRALRALGGNETHLGWFKEKLKLVNTGRMALEEFVQLVLTNDYFAHDGNAEGYGDEDPELDEEVKSDGYSDEDSELDEEVKPAVVQLAETLPDENAVLREELVQRLSQQIGSNTKYRTSNWWIEQQQQK